MCPVTLLCKMVNLVLICNRLELVLFLTTNTFLQIVLFRFDKIGQIARYLSNVVLK